MKTLLNSEKLKTIITSDLRQGFLLGLLFGGLIFLSLSDALDHSLDKVIIIALEFIAPILGIYILISKRK